MQRFQSFIFLLPTLCCSSLIALKPSPLLHRPNFLWTMQPVLRKPFWSLPAWKLSCLWREQRIDFGTYGVASMMDTVEDLWIPVIVVTWVRSDLISERMNFLMSGGNWVVYISDGGEAYGKIVPAATLGVAASVVDDHSRGKRAWIWSAEKIANHLELGLSMLFSCWQFTVRHAIKSTLGNCRFQLEGNRVLHYECTWNVWGDSSRRSISSCRCRRLKVQYTIRMLRKILHSKFKKILHSKDREIRTMFLQRKPFRKVPSCLCEVMPHRMQLIPRRRLKWMLRTKRVNELIAKSAPKRRKLDQKSAQCHLGV